MGQRTFRQLSVHPVADLWSPAKLPVDEGLCPPSASALGRLMHSIRNPLEDPSIIRRKGTEMAASKVGQSEL